MKLLIDKDFCIFLEYWLTETFPTINDKAINRFWCDGVRMPPNDNECLPKTVNDKRQINMTAYIGEDGQDEYKLQLNFGSKSLSRYARGLEIQPCVPKSLKPDRFLIDIHKRVLIIKLD